MKKFIKTLLTLLLSVSICSFAFAQKQTLAISKIQTSPSLEGFVKTNEGKLALDRITQSLESNLSFALANTRKFDLVTRTNLDAVIEEQNLASSGNTNLQDKNAKEGNLKAAKYLLVINIDDFQDLGETSNFESLSRQVINRHLRIGLTSQIIDSSTGSVFESINFTISNDDIEDQDTLSYQTGGSATDRLIGVLTRQLSEKIANGLVEIIYPSKIIAKSGFTVSINKGSQTDVRIGQEYEIFALSEPMIDPDTGENLGNEEVLIGKMIITDVYPKFSKAKLIEDNGVDVGQIIRLSKNVENSQNTLSPIKEQL